MALVSFSRRNARPPPPPAEEAQPAPAGEDARRPVRIGLAVLVLGFGGFLLWASVAPLDEGVVAPGSVSIDTRRKAVQHLTGGIISQVLVHEGERVRAGQPLVRLDAAAAKANYESARQRYLGLRAVQARLLAEQAGAGQIAWPSELVEAARDPLVRQQMDNQQQLLASRRAALAAEVQALQESVRGQEGLIVSYRQMMDSRRGQLALLQEELKNTRELVQEGYVPRNRQLELERMVADSVTAQADLQGNAVRAQQAILELKQRELARRQDYRKEIEQQLADVSRDVIAEGERFRSVRNDLERTEIRAPADGQVVGLATQTVGGVVQPGQKLMDIVPEHDPLLLEARVPPQFIDRVHAGLAVDIRFSSFAHSPQLVVAGQVRSVSGDLITEGQNTPPYYLARVSVTPEGLRALGPRQLQPGMPAEVVFRTGERSLLTYLLHPLAKRMAASMKEE
ncbi:HlyD family type I secretion periplasmic adaptor subunit [Ramlibacter alkalitolerans]|uniref:Membrane fusion protein (MFP) family protein n=1 Tax=Ramlibacter alkalitolerans TaxID=2039631 RepID=A0ABS1JMD3_9BURK|nr:HlyD family type I secretion periplasmic adaptor subunit [Ramlibacter alkalitolerans]MBL0425397.1 HlyD family type I secretion periplasmic adaptor subunit [Ramlibacter alkalitolerans]